MENNFYRKFEDKFRGSRELIKDRLKVYLPFILPLNKIYPSGLILDIGCGRGEWLELLKENNIHSLGIDTDEGMLEACCQLSLNSKKGDGIDYLKKQSSESMIVISAFHLVEHILFEDLQTLVSEALRVLKPGGLLMLETPNPENIKVATENFYRDPTHGKPIPSSLLSFLAEHYGFARVKVLRLQENEDIINSKNISLMHVIEGVSPDYAVIAQKKASTEIMLSFDNVFSREFGLSLEELTKRFDERLRNIEMKFTPRRLYKFIQRYLLKYKNNKKI